MPSSKRLIQYDMRGRFVRQYTGTQWRAVYALWRAQLPWPSRIVVR